MKLGAVVSTAGGLHLAFERADELEFDSFMIITKSNRQWFAKPIDTEQLEAWQSERAANPHLDPIAAHAGYLINLASPRDDLYSKSYRSLREEWDRAELLDIPTLTFHPGSHVGSGEEAGMERISRALSDLLADRPDNQTTICLETMAGQGTYLGYRFEQLAWIIENTRGGERLGVCFDPCHVFAAGYDIKTSEGYAETMQDFDNEIGLDRLRCFHLNDSVNGLGSRKDRHAHIGKGELGEEVFWNLLHDGRFSDHPGHMETPKWKEDDEGNKQDMDIKNLAVLRRLENEESYG